MSRFDPVISKKVKDWLLTDVKRSVIIPHVNPDGDAIGSAFGLNQVLRCAGIESSVISPSDFPSNLNWLTKNVSFFNYEKHKEESLNQINRADVIFFLDFNDIKRIGKLRDFMTANVKPSILIDHHPNPGIRADYVFCDIEVSSTAELVYDFLNETGLAKYLDQKGAEALLAGIIADTGSFSHNAFRSGMYKTAGKLIDLGADKERISDQLFNNFSEKRMRLLGYCLAHKLEIFQEYCTALIWLSKDELKEYDFHPGDTEGFVNYPLSITGIVLSVFFMEMPDMIKISFRSKGNFPTNMLSATHFHGGGHINASGGELKTSMEEALKFFRQILPSYSIRLWEENSKLN